MARQRQERAERTRAALIRAAAEIFDQVGYHGAGLNAIAGLLIGARYNISLNDLYKQPLDGSGGAGTVNFKNNVVQLFVGYRF